MSGLLFFIGLGLYDEKGITIRGLELARKAKEVYVELYTNRMYINLDKLESIIGKEVKVLNRKDLEERGIAIVKRSKRSDVALLIPGDCFAATTHLSLLVEALNSGVGVRYEPGVSIFTAAPGFAGLQIYKFGPPATIPLHVESRRPYDVIHDNKNRGLHTLLLLECDEERKLCLSISDALKLLFKLEKRYGGDVIKLKDEIVCLGNLGSPSPRVIVGLFGDLMQLGAREFGEPPYTIIYLGRLHFLEREALNALSRLYV